MQFKSDLQAFIYCSWQDTMHIAQICPVCSHFSYSSTYPEILIPYICIYIHTPWSHLTSSTGTRVARVPVAQGYCCREQAGLVQTLSLAVSLAHCLSRSPSHLCPTMPPAQLHLQGAAGAGLAGEVSGWVSPCSLCVGSWAAPAGPALWFWYILLWNKKGGVFFPPQYVYISATVCIHTIVVFQQWWLTLRLMSVNLLVP